MCCCAARVGRSMRNGCIDCIASWACNSATKRPSAGSGRSCETIDARRHDQTRPGRWTLSMDQLATGRKLRVLTILDIFSRFSPALEPRFNFSGADVVRVLEGVCKEVGFPAAIRVDQGSEFVSRDLDLWAYQRGVTLDFSRP